MKVRLHVEGGGTAKTSVAACRRGFAELFKKVVPEDALPSVIAGGSVEDAYGDFRRSLETHPDAFNVLIIDSDDPVGTQTPWAYVHAKRGWQRPVGVGDDNLHFMVQVMESWFLSNRALLREFYGRDFHEGRLPGNPQIEQIPKGDVLNGLHAATRQTKKGAYHKTHHGFDILARLDPVQLQHVAPQAQRLMEVVVARADP